MNRSSFQRAVEHIAQHGDTDVFPFPPENHVFHDRGTEMANVLERTHAEFATRLDVDTTTGVSAMSPVGYTGFRWASQLDPLWNAYLLSLMVEMGPAIEQNRVAASLVPSHRFVETPENAEIFARDGYLEFESLSVDSAGDSSWVVVTDIADFYPRLNHHRLENALDEVSDGSDLPYRVLRLLSRWSDKKSYGIPVGGPAARLLSELLLDRTDKLLRSRGLKFHRYADDYRLFANSKEEAHRALVGLSDLLLRNEGLALSKQKTRIMSRAEFLSSVSGEAEIELDEADLSLEQRGRRRRARELLGLSLRYDPYSPTAVEDYEALKDAVERIDIVDLFMVELSKPRIDPRMVRKLLRALHAAEPSAKGAICTSLVQNLELLAPLVPQVLQAIRRVLDDVDPAIAGETLGTLATQIESGSHVFELGVNRAFALRVLSMGKLRDVERLFAAEFDSGPAYIQRDIVLAMTRWKATYWLSDKKTQYESLHPWVKRAFLMCSYELGDEGSHWRRSIRSQLSPFDEEVRQWASARSQDVEWVVPL